VFEAPSTKTDKIYSSTLNIQPIRQINLPDTHIFTPTDSETPRSKTIHYDTTHSILMPQQVNVMKTQPEGTSSQSSSNAENDSEYWEFQDFKGNTDVTNQNEEHKPNEAIKDIQPKQNHTYETQVLQPIKLEPIMPTLNWPNPGEVKETFDDFSDFITKSALISDNPISNLEQESGSNVEEESTVENKMFGEPSQKKSEQLDDDFDMFQSALPSTTNISQSETGNSAKSVVDQNKSNLDTIFPKINHIKSDNISLPNMRPINDVKQITSNIPKVDESKFKAPPNIKPIINSNLLQPTLLPSVTQQNQQNSGQILQPLSLESYSQINWPNPGIDLHDLSRFNPVESLQSLKNDASNLSKNSSPVHSQKNITNNQAPDEDWGEFVSSAPKPQQALKKQSTFVDDDEWTDFVSSPSVNPQNGLNTISLNVHTNSNIQKSSNSSKYPRKNNEIPLDIPTLNYITPKTSTQKAYNDRHFQNL
jgi:hypothetical protein